MNTEDDQIKPLISAIYDNKKFIERFVGVTKYKWKFKQVHYHGTCRMPVPFNDFDAVICGVLHVKPMSFIDLGHVIGLIVDENNAANCLLNQAIDELIKRQIVVLQDQTYTLTEDGMDCYKRQQKPETEEHEFDLIYNAVGTPIKNAHKIFEILPFKPSFDSDSKETNDFEHIKECAAEQLPDIHCPEKNILLLNARVQVETTYSTELLVAIFHNCRDNSLRALVFDGKNIQPIDAFSEALSEDREELKKVVDSIVKENNEDKEQFKLEYKDWRNEREFIKDKKQQNEDELTINSQQQYDEAIKNNHPKIAAQIRETALQNKTYFDAIEFENEMLRLLDTTNGDIWLISPWLKKAARRLIPHIENYLNRGGRVFVFYSYPESYNTQMVDEEVLKRFKQLDKQYSNFYISQSETPFHDKHLFLRNVQKPVHFTGSYNILSFNAANQESAIRQETMIKLDWTEETEHIYFFQYHNHFARTYLKKAEEELCPVVEKIYILAKNAYSSDWRSKLSNAGRNHYFYNYDKRDKPFSFYWSSESFPYRDYAYILDDFEKDPKAFISKDERKELIFKLKEIKLDYLEPFANIKTKKNNISLYSSQLIDDSKKLIDFQRNFIKLLRDMNKIKE